jgi:hypothetical protein
MVTDLLAVALDGMDEPSQQRIVRLFRRLAGGAPSPAQVAWRNALARFAAERTEIAANLLVAAGLDLTPDARDAERRTFDTNGLSSPGSGLHGIITALLDLLDVTSYPVDVRSLDALRAEGVHAVALPATFYDADGAVIARAVAVGR